MVSVQFCKIFTGPSFWDGWAKKFKLLLNVFFDSGFQKIVMPSIRVLVLF